MTDTHADKNTNDACLLQCCKAHAFETAGVLQHAVHSGAHALLALAVNGNNCACCCCSCSQPALPLLQLLPRTHSCLAQLPRCKQHSQALGGCHACRQQEKCARAGSRRELVLSYGSRHGWLILARLRHTKVSPCLCSNTYTHTHLVLQPVALCWVVPGALGLVAVQLACLCDVCVNRIDGPLELVGLWIKVVDVVQPAAREVAGAAEEGQAGRSCGVEEGQQQQANPHRCPLLHAGQVQLLRVQVPWVAVHHSTLP